MTANELTLATFNVPSDDWESFKKMAKKDSRSASYYLNQFIKQSVSTGSFEPVSEPSVSDIDLSGVESLVNEKIENRVNPEIEGLKSAIASLRSEIESLKELEPVS